MSIMSECWVLSVMISPSIYNTQDDVVGAWMDLAIGWLSDASYASTLAVHVDDVVTFIAVYYVELLFL